MYKLEGKILFVKVGSEFKFSALDLCDYGSEFLGFWTMGNILENTVSFSSS
jgi:hypothetical protein